MSEQRRRRLVGILAVVLCLSSSPSRGAAGDSGSLPTYSLIPPVDALIERRFEEPDGAYGRGHRGIDYAVASGTRVRAAAAGTISWAGPVAGRLAVTIDHGGGLETTYSILSEVEVIRSDVVDEGHWLGRVGRAHDGSADGLHFGVKLHDRYVDPLDFLGPSDLGDAIHLAPLIESESDLPPELHLANEGAGSTARACRDPLPIDSPPPPNDNVAVAIAGVSSSTSGGTDAAILERPNGPVSLGYPPGRVYRFSYRGTRGPDLHEPYVAADTWRDINHSALLLRRLLVRIARKHPGRDVDLFGHSQGGLVARAMVERAARAYDPRVPRIEHLVTYGTPHVGTTLADVPARLAGETITGRFFVRALSDRARDGRFSVDPEGTAIDQMRPGSSFINALALEDVSFGTRVLALATAHDLIVPTGNALWPGEDSRVLSPDMWNGHREAVASDQGRALAYAFLRDAPASCTGNWDEWGPLLSRAVGVAHGLLDDAYAEVETLGFAKVLRALKWAGSNARRGVEWIGRFVRSGIARLW